MKPFFPVCAPELGAGTFQNQRIYVNLTRIPDPAVIASNGLPMNQLFVIVGGVSNIVQMFVPPDPADVRPLFTAFLERAAVNDDSRYEYGAGVAGRDPGPGRPRHGGAHQWFLLSYQWDLAATSFDGVHSLRADRRVDPSIWYADLAGQKLDPAGLPESPSGPSVPWYDFNAMAAGGPPGEQRLTLGSTWSDAGVCTRGIYGSSWVYLGAPADATLDEFAIYDPGAAPAASGILALNRTVQGRYYKGEDGRWTSALIELPPGSRVVGLDWTLLLPTADSSWAEDPNRVFQGTGADPASGRSADALLELRDAAGQVRYASSLSGMGRNRTALGLPDGRLRISATLRAQLGDNAPGWDALNAPLLESPVLDDITVLWMPPGGPRVLLWEEE